VNYYWERVSEEMDGDYVVYLQTIDGDSPSHCDWIVPGTYNDPEWP
jgi:hypothetical protein